DRELVEADEVERDRYRLAREPDRDVPAAAPGGLEPEGHPGLVAGAIDGDVGLARAVVGRARVEAQEAGRVGPRLGRGPAPHVHRPPGRTCDLGREQTGRARPGDEDVVADAQLALLE